MASRTDGGRLTAMKSRIPRDVDANVSKALAARRLHHDLTLGRIDEPVHAGRVVSEQDRETITCFDREAEAALFERALEPRGITDAGHRACAHERFRNHAAQHVQ